MRSLPVMLLAASVTLAAGCTTATPPAPAPAAVAAAPAIMDESVPQAAREACLAEVARTTNNRDVAIIEMLFSQANSQVKVGVGPERAPWQCLVSNTGVVANVMSLTNEGAL